MEVIFHHLLNALCGFVANIVSGFILGVIKPLLCSVVYFREVMPVDPFNSCVIVLNLLHINGDIFGLHRITS